MDNRKQQNQSQFQQQPGGSSGGGGSVSGSIEGTIADADNMQHESLSTSINSNLMSTSQISTASSSNAAATEKSNLNITHHTSGVSPRFPKLEECAHFHYERVQLGRIHIRLVDEKNNDCTGSIMNETSSNRATTSSDWFIMKISAGRSDPFLVRRSFDNLQLLDSMLHRCVYDRRISELCDLSEIETRDEEALEDAVSEYLAKFSLIASDTITCGSILTWLQLDNKGRRLPVADRDTMRTINTPAVGAAYGVRRYMAQACDEISIEVGDMISVIDMPSPAESVWWRGKKSHLQKNQYEVGFFPQNCVAIIGEKVPRNMRLPPPLVGSLAVSPTKPVLRKHGKLISFFRSFILARPSRRRLKQSGIYKERVFSCDLSEHLLNSQQDIPLVLKHCAEFIENLGIVDGIYRLSGITSTIQKLRRAFDEERVPDLTGPEFRHDIHAISSLLKMYFRELPNPLCTYQLYDEFVDAIQTKVDNAEQRLILIKKVVQKLPPPHYRTLKYLAMHLYKISRYSESTGMTERNIAIVWAPNLLRSPALESGGVAALKGVGVQAVVTEYLISKCEDIFDDSYIPEGFDSQPESLSSLNSVIGIDEIPERPKSLNVCQGAKLITLEEAQIKQNRVSLESKSIPIATSNLPAGCTSYIEVGGGPASLPDKYHTILPMPKNKRKPNSIMSLFYRPKQSTNNVIDSVTPEETKLDLQESKSPEPEIIIKSPQIEYKRSNSIDSLKTHSRSVSHDSYFDLLQSPLRGIVCPPSRELSELGMNFDREEPEMRIFSEAESLVSSPKVKDGGRRIKVKLEDTTVSINPSPKKQPRLNIPTPSPIEEGPNAKKFEEQLSDLQFIDSPEHNHEKDDVTLRYSYPNYDRATVKRDERFSLPSPTQMTIDTSVEDATPKMSPITPMGYSLLIGSCSTMSKQEKSESESELTPSDIGYQMHKDETPRSDFDIYDYMKPVLDMSPIKTPKSPPTTPVRATIQITYNIKEPSPCRTSEANDYEEVFVKTDQMNDKKGLLETTFDDTIVYEQVKFLKSAVSELNEMINDEHMDTSEQQVPEKIDGDVAMTTCDPEDSLEYDAQLSMYENVQQPKPKAVYENVNYVCADDQKIDNKYADKEVEYSFEVPHKLELKTPQHNHEQQQSTSVRALATKFETSPVDTNPPFDFKPLQRQPSTPTKVKKELTAPLTRSLDENAFVREFGSARRAPNNIGILTESNVSRRKSGGEKTLNQPKKLPGLRSSSNNNNEYCKIQFDNQRKMPPIPTKITPTTENRISLIQQNFEHNTKSNNNKPMMRYFDSIPKASAAEPRDDMLNVVDGPKGESEIKTPEKSPRHEDKIDDDEKSLSSISSLVLSTCKLDRERIEKIKEERRHQLNEKFRSESFKTSGQMKSKSRPDVRDIGNDGKDIPTETQSLRVKSKSRTELSASKLSIAESEISLRTRRNSESRSTKGAKESNQTKDTLVCCDKPNKVELRRTKPVEQSRKSADYRNSNDKLRSADTPGSDRMSIKDVAAMFESKSQNF